MTRPLRPVGRIVSIGLLMLGVGAERFLNAAMTDAVLSYATTRFIVAVVCTTIGAALLTAGVVKRLRK